MKSIKSGVRPFAVLWLVAFCAAVGCEIGSDSDDAGFVADDGGAPRDAGAMFVYTFVRIEDQALPESGEHAGADIDAVAILRPDGSRVWGTMVEETGMVSNSDGALGEPMDPVECAVGGFASLGGEDNGIIVSFGETFGAGDSIEVYELDSTECALSGDETSVNYGVAVNEGTAMIPNWNSIGNCSSAGVCTLAVPVP